MIMKLHMINVITSSRVSHMCIYVCKVAKSAFSFMLNQVALTAPATAVAVPLIVVVVVVTATICCSDTVTAAVVRVVVLVSALTSGQQDVHTDINEKQTGIRKSLTFTPNFIPFILRLIQIMSNKL